MAEISMDNAVLSVRKSKDPARRHQISDSLAATEQTITYPSDWFNNPRNAGMKPPIVVAYSDGLTLHALRQWVFYGIKNHTLNVEVSIAYLINMLEYHPYKITEAWTSFGRIIANPNDMVTVSDLLSITSDRASTALDGPEVHGVLEEWDRWMSLYICAIYRICNATHESHINKIVELVDTQLKLHKADDAAKGNNIRMYFMTWLQNPNFNKLMAAIDMYMCRFPKHNFAYLRIGTLVSRFRDCVALTELTYICKTISMPPSEMARWIWTPLLADELVQLNRPGNEITEYHSYMPYFMPLCLGDKSPYSAVANPNFHLWLHIVCITLGSKRSKNARMVGMPNFGNTRLNACVLAYAVGTIMNIEQQFNEDGDEDADDEDQQNIGIGDGTDPNVMEVDAIVEMARNMTIAEPNSLDGDEWLNYIKIHERRLTPKMVKKCKSVWVKLERALREGSVGEYLFELSGEDVDLEDDRRDH